MRSISIFSVGFLIFLIRMFSFSEFIKCRSSDLIFESSFKFTFTFAGLGKIYIEIDTLFSFNPRISFTRIVLHNVSVLQSFSTIKHN